MAFPSGPVFHAVPAPVCYDASAGNPAGITDEGFWESAWAASGGNFTGMLMSPTLLPSPMCGSVGFLQPICSFGALDVFNQLLPTEATRQVLTLRVHERATCRVRISNAIMRPAGCLYFFENAPPVNTVVSPGQSVRIPIRIDKNAAAATYNPNYPIAISWCLVEVETTTVCHQPQIHWRVTRGFLGAELRTNLLKFSSRRPVRLNALAPSHFPESFSQCFENSGAPTLPPLMDESVADSMIPSGIRRVQATVGRIVLECPPAESRTGDLTAAGDNEATAFEKYKRRLLRGLFLEVEQMFVDIKKYDMCGVALQFVLRQPNYVRLPVEGVYEGRPSLALFDPVRLRPIHSALFNEVEIIARVTSIDMLNRIVTLRLPTTAVHNQVLSSILSDARNGNVTFRCHVRFCVGSHFISNSRLLETVENLDEACYSRIHDMCPPLHPIERASRADRAVSSLLHLVADSPLLAELNKKQLEAVYLASVASYDDISMPVCIIGPPGTGKTRTLAAAIAITALRHRSATKVLATAPSHEAADILCERIAEFLSSLNLLNGDNAITMFRLIPAERQVAFARVGTYRYFLQNQDGLHDLPSAAQLARYNIIVSSCLSATLLKELNGDHFVHGVYCDESAQSLQPEALVPIQMFGRRSRIVLGGDPQQLNAEVRSDKAAECGIHISLMESLVREREENGNEDFNILLRVNYRVSHSALVALPSALFYQNAIELSPNAQDRPIPVGLSEVFPGGFPIAFRAVFFTEKRVTERSRARVNVEEADHVAQLCKRMVQGGGNGTAPCCQQSQIGVIAPFRSQVQEIRAELRKLGLDSVKVGMVTDYQGQEEDYLIVSLTLSSRTSLRAEAAYSQSFVNSPKVFNVIITRARHGLIVVGNPKVFSRDKYWGTLIRLCKLGMHKLDDLASEFGSPRNVHPKAFHDSAPFGTIDVDEPPSGSIFSEADSESALVTATSAGARRNHGVHSTQDPLHLDIDSEDRPWQVRL